MQRFPLAKSISRRQVLTAIAAGATCITTGAAVTVLDVATTSTAPRIEPQYAASTAPFVLSF